MTIAKDVGEHGYPNYGSSYVKEQCIEFNFSVQFALFYISQALLMDSVSSLEECSAQHHSPNQGEKR